MHDSSRFKLAGIELMQKEAKLHTKFASMKVSSIRQTLHLSHQFSTGGKRTNRYEFNTV